MQWLDGTLTVVSRSLRLGWGPLLRHPGWLQELPPDVRELALARYRDPRSWSAGRREWRAAVEEFVASGGRLPDIRVPVLVVTSGRTLANEAGQELHEDIARAAPRTERHVIHGAGHDQVLTDPGPASRVAGADRRVHQRGGRRCARGLKPGRPGRPAGRGVPTLLAAAGFAAWFWVTAASSNPQKVFDRLRDIDPTGLAIPNWRFFAPEPARHDYHVLHRVLTHEDEETGWQETSTISPRRWRHMVWFPGHRGEKALFDLAHDLLSTLTREPGADVTPLAPYRTLREFVEQAVRRQYAGQPLPKGFQFVLARYGGHDDRSDPECLLMSVFVPLEPGAAAA